MSCKISGFVGLAVILSLAGCSNPAVEATPYAMTSWGHPDLQGVWDYRSITPLERPDELGERTEFSQDEAGEYTRSNPERQAEIFRDFLIVGGEPWADAGRELSESTRAALIFDPPNGKLPRRTELGANNASAFVAQFFDTPAGPEDRPVQERCIVYPRIPLSSGNYNNNLQIVQTPTHVVLLMEMMHHARIVPFDDRPLSSVREWLGQSRARWQDDTLIVETTNFRDYFTPLGTSPDMLITERFTRNNGDELNYEYTVVDPQAFVAPWSARQTLVKTDERVYEYACHEANYSMAATLRGARTAELEVAAGLQRAE